MLIPNMNRLIGAGKEGRIYVVNTLNMGKYNTVASPCTNQTPNNIDKIVQELPPSTIGGMYSNAAYWKNASGQQYVYFAGANDSAKMFALNSNGTLSTAPLSPQTFGFTGGNPTVSSNNGAAGTGIVWTVDPTPALRAYDATNLTKQLYSTTQNSARDGLDSYVKFSTSTVANGEVFVGTKTVLDIFGLIPNTGVTPTPTTPTPTTPTPTPPPSTAFNNVGTSHDNATTSGNYDNGGYSYSAEALVADGITAGGTVNSDGIAYTWPSASPGTANDYLASGQKINLLPVANADHLGFLGSTTNGASSGTATITYTDNTTKQFTLGFTDWTTAKISFGNSVVATMPYRDTYNGGRQTITTYLFATSVAVDPTRTVASVTLPATTTGGQIHVFAVGTGSSTAAIYNNVGITDNGNVVPGNFDGAGNSYSAQALQAAGLNAGDNAFDPTRTVTFTWPGVPAGTADNYLTSGQVIPITPAANATTLGFLGSAANGATSGTATITYTDNTTKQFTLGFSDWTLNASTVQPSFRNQISYTATYRSNPRATGGRENVKTYVFYASYTLPTNGKTIQSVTLPSSVTGGQMHVFAITTK